MVYFFNNFGRGLWFGFVCNFASQQSLTLIINFFKVGGKNENFGTETSFLPLKISGYLSG